MNTETQQSTETVPGAERSSGGPGRRRDEATRQKILQVAFDTLRTDGLRGFTIEGVALRSGAGKTTIYRWWPSKAALAVDAFLDRFPAEIQCRGTGSVIGDLREHMRALADNLAGDNGRVLGAILSGGRDDPETLQLYRERILMPWRERGRRLLQRGIEAGEIRADLAVDAALDALFMPLVVRLSIKVGKCDSEWVDSLCDTVVRGIRPGH